MDKEANITFFDEKIVRKKHRLDSRNFDFSIAIHPAELSLANTTIFNETTMKSILDDDRMTTRSFIETQQPWKDTADSMYTEFFEIIQASVETLDVLSVVADMARCCSDTLNVVRGIKSRVAVETTDCESWLENERNTWRLLYVLYGNRLKEEEPKDGEGIMYVGRSEKYSMFSLFKRDSLVTESQLVVDWLECNAAQSEQKHVHLTDGSVGWENTLHQLKSKETIVFETTRQIVSNMDPDAMHYQKMPLHDLDMDDEKRLCQKVFTEIRCGRLDDSQKLCIHKGHPWRATLLEGWKLYHDPNLPDPFASEFSTVDENAGMESGDAVSKYKPIEGNINRDLWKATGWKYCEMESLTIWEKASMAAYCGNLDCLLKVCNTWEDHLWAYMRVMIDIRVESEIRENVTKNYMPLPEEYWSQRMSINEIFECLEASRFDIVRNEALIPHHLIQKYIILDEMDKLVELIMDWVIETNITTQFLRFLSHLALFLEQISQISKEVVERVLDEYLKRLIDMKQTNLIAFYVSKLNEVLQTHIYSSYLETIVDSEGRREALNAAESCELDVQAITKQVVENIRDKHDANYTQEVQPQVTQFDEYKICALDWLLFYDSQVGECLKQANHLIFMFLTLKKLDAAQLAFNKIPLDVVDKLKSDGEVPDGLVPHIREYFSYKAYLDAHDAFNTWYKSFKSKPMPPQAPSSGAAFTEKVAYEHRVSQYQAEIGRWKLTIDHLSKLAKTALHNVLLFPDGGWLGDTHDAEYLKSTCIPECVVLLYTVLDGSEQWEECVQLADLLADEKHKLYKVYSKEKLAEIFIKLCAASNALLNTKKDPWGNDMSA